MQWWCCDNKGLRSRSDQSNFVQEQHRLLWHLLRLRKLLQHRLSWVSPGMILPSDTFFKILIQFNSMESFKLVFNSCSQINVTLNILHIVSHECEFLNVNFWNTTTQAVKRKSLSCLWTFSQTFCLHWIKIQWDPFENSHLSCERFHNELHKSCPKATYSKTQSIHLFFSFYKLMTLSAGRANVLL